METDLALRLILASGSPARRDLLARAGLSFEVQPPQIEEPDPAGVTDIRAYVHQAAWLKAAAVAARIQNGVICAADTVGWLNGRVIGKPADEADARRILQQLAGTQHELWSGVVLWRRPDNLQLCWQEMSRVVMTSLTPAQVDAYLATRTWQGCSGAYAIQEEGDPYIRVAEGSLSNVIGLPMETTYHYLRILAAIPPRP